MFNLLKQKVFGLDLSDLSIKIAQLKKEKGGIILAAHSRYEIPEGVIDNGEIKDESALVEAISDSVRQVKGLALKTKYCVVSLPETEAFIQMIRLPQMQEKELAEAIKWETENYIPLSIEEVYFDWRIIKPIEGDADHCDILVGALKKGLVDSYLAVFKKIGLQPLVFEIESIATARSLVKDGFSSDPIMIVDIGAKRTSFIVFSGWTIHFTASLPISNEYFVNEISQCLQVDKKEAKRLKFEIGLNQENGHSRVYEAMLPSLKEVTANIRKYIDFYRDHGLTGHFKNSKEVSKILLCGGGANLNGLPAWLSKELKIEAEVGNPWLNILAREPEKIPELPYEQSIGYATALGLALHGLELGQDNFIDLKLC